MLPLERSERRYRFLGERSLRVLPGQYYDAETGKHYNYMRDFDPAIGRYIESDPIGLNGGINTFAYVESDPLGNFDPSGLVTYMCTKPLHKLGGHGLRSGLDVPGNPLYHQYICVPDGKGGRSCGGQDDGSGFGFGPGKPSSDGYAPQQCVQVENDNKCIEKCLRDAIDDPNRPPYWLFGGGTVRIGGSVPGIRSEEHTSELQSPCNLVCRL